MIGINIADRDYFKQVMVVDQPTISAPLRNRVGGEPVVTFAAPVHDREGRIIGLIGAGLYLLKPNFLGDLRDMRIGETGRVYLVERGSRPLSSFIRPPTRCSRRSMRTPRSRRRFMPIPPRCPIGAVTW